MDLSYTVRRSEKRKKLTITVERDRTIVVHAPAHASDEAIKRIVQSKKLWIFEKSNHKQKYRERLHPPGKELVSGESALYLGRQYRIEIVKDDLKEIKFAHGFMIPASHVNQRKDAMRDWYIARAREKILPRVDNHARNLGVEFKQAKIVDSRYRWGSCTIKDNLNFNWRLIKAPTFVIDYVIVHELAHLIEANHTADFWNVVRTQAPTMDKARIWLKENGQILEEDI